MKTFSVVLTFALLFLAQQLGMRLRRAGALPVTDPGSAAVEQNNANGFPNAVNPPFIRL